MFMHRTTILTTAFMFLATAVYADVAAAQSPGEETQVAGVLEEVRVTAQRRDESVLDVPIAISAFSGEQLEQAGVLRTNDLSIVTPGLQLNSIATNGQAFLRGIGTTNLGGNVEGAVAYYVDDIYYADTAGVLMSLNNVERVEILKGPQGTLYGRNATGGLIHVITPDPQADGYVRAQIGYESYNTITGSLYVTGGSDQLKVSFAATYHDQGEGFGTNLTRNEDANYIRNEAYRGKVLWEPTDSDRVTVVASYYKDTSDMGGIQMVAENTINAFGVPYPGDPYDALQNVDPDHLSEAYNGSIKWEHSLAHGMEFKSVTAYRRSDFSVNIDVDFGPLPIGENNLVRDMTSIQQEFLLQGTTDRVAWTTGFFFIRSETDFSPVINANVPTPGGIVSIQQVRPTALDLDSYALFGQADYQLTDRDTLTVGLRYTIDEQKIDAKIFSITPGGPVLLPGATVDSEDFGEPTWRLALKHDFSDGLMGYASYSRGYRSGIYNSTPPYQIVDPEFLDAYELGLKGNFANGNLQLDVNGFYYDYEDMQLLTIINNIAFLTNAAKSEIYGLEANAAWSVPVPVGDLVLRGNLSLMDSEFKEYVGCKIIVPNFPLPGNTVTNDGDCSGNTLPFTPDFTSNLGVNYSLPVGNAGGEIGMGVLWYHSDGAENTPDNVVKQDSYDLVNAEVSYQFPNSNFAIRAYGRNLLDETVSVITAGDAAFNHIPISPRIYGAELAYRWD